MPLRRRHDSLTAPLEEVTVPLQIASTDVVPFAEVEDPVDPQAPDPDEEPYVSPAVARAMAGEQVVFPMPEEEQQVVVVVDETSETDTQE